jgi:hypothetical protein
MLKKQLFTKKEKRGRTDLIHPKVVVTIRVTLDEIVHKLALKKQGGKKARAMAKYVRGLIEKDVGTREKLLQQEIPTKRRLD